MPKYHIAESIVIEADPQSVFELVSDFNTWTTWSPWLLADPDANVTVSGDGRSLGDVYAWDGECTGQGEVEHQKLEPGKQIVDELRFIKPFKSVCSAGFQFQSVGAGTKLTWTMDGKMPWFMFWMVPLMKTFISMDYRRGLLMIKDLVETGSIPSTTTVHDRQPIGPITMAGIAGSCPVSNVGPSMEPDIERLQSEFENANIPMKGEMMAAYTKFHVKRGVFEYIVGFPIPSGTDLPTGSELVKYEIPETEAFHVKHVGAYRHLGNGWSVANQLVRYKKMKQRKCATFEIYRNSPCEAPENELETDIYLPLK